MATANFHKWLDPNIVNAGQKISHAMDHLPPAELPGPDTGPDYDFLAVYNGYQFPGASVSPLPPNARTSRFLYRAFAGRHFSVPGSSACVHPVCGIRRERISVGWKSVGERPAAGFYRRSLHSCRHGLMAIAPLGDRIPGKHDIVLYAAPTAIDGHDRKTFDGLEGKRRNCNPL